MMVTTTDGRNIDQDLGTLSGEGSQVKVRSVDAADPVKIPVPVSEEGMPARTRDYYGLAPVKPVPWKWYIPTYFFLGGLAGGASTLAAATHVFGRGDRREFVARARLVSFGAIGAGAVCLIADLGRPTRFVDMMRVFRPSSPMNVGTWILSGAGASAALAALGNFGSGALRSVGDVAGVLAGLFGLPLSGYTAVLVGNTAVPIWKRTRVALPAVFVASSAASGGSALELAAPDPATERVARNFSVLGKLGELAASAWVEREASRAPSVAEPFRRGPASFFWNGARALTIASLGLSLFAKSKAAKVASGVLGLAGALGMRFAIMRAGRMSAMDPAATFLPQRAEG